AWSFDNVFGDPTVATIFSGNDAGAAATTGNFALTPVTQFTFQLAAPVASIQTSQVKVCWNSLSNVTYQVQYRSALTTNEWTPLIDCVRGTGQTNCIVDNLIADQPQRFYRVVVSNCVPL